MVRCLGLPSRKVYPPSQAVAGQPDQRRGGSLRWQHELEQRLSHSGVMACRSILGRILEAARKERLIATNPVREVEAPKPRLDPEQVFGHQRRRTLTPEEVGHLLAACRPFYRDHFLIQVGTGLRSGELLGLRRRRVFPELGRIEVIEVRFEAGRFGRGFKAEPKSLASVRVVPMCDKVRQAIARQLAGGTRPEDLLLPGPGGSNGIPRGARAPLSTNNLRRVYKAAVEAAGDELVHLDLRGPHDLRHTFATWLEDAAIPSRVIDELMGHASGRRDRSTASSTMGRVYRETTPGDGGPGDRRLGRPPRPRTGGCCVSAARGPGFAGGRRRRGPLTWGGAEGI
jgi:integrase